MQEAPIQAEHKTPQDDVDKLDELIRRDAAREGGEEPDTVPGDESGGGGTGNPPRPPARP